MGSVTTLLNAPPRQVPAGDTLEYLEAIPADYVGWTGSARLTGPSTMDATDCTVEGGDFHIRFAGQAINGTKELEAGQYTLTVFVTSVDGADRFRIKEHRLTVLPDAATVDDGRSFASRMLAILETAIEARVSGNTDGGIESYIVDGVSISKHTLADLERLRTKYANEVANQQNLGVIPSVELAFTKPYAVPMPFNFLGR
jgi:hypothetical protein